MKYVGVDPGATGSIAWTTDDSMVACKMPSTERDVVYLLRSVCYGDARVVLERVGGYIGGGPPCPVCHQPQNKSPGSAMFHFGRGAGVIVGCLLSLGVAFDEVEPQVWQSALGLRKPRSMKQDDWKRQLKTFAQKLYPQLRVTLATADALLLARFATLQCTGVSAAVDPDADPHITDLAAWEMFGGD